MIKNKLALFILVISIGLFSCIKNNDTIYNGTVVEFDPAVYNSNNAYILPTDSIAFPILTRNPAIGRAITTADATLARTTSSAVSLRVNLVGAPRKQATIVNYRVVNKNEYNLIGATSNTNEQAVAGTHYTALPGNITIPADSSFGYINVTLMNPGTSSATPRELVLMLTESADVKPSRNYKVAGLRISQQ
jgi:hypothetical protein